MTPVLVALWLSATTSPEVVLEDVGDVSLWSVTEAGEAETFFGRALDLLADIQSRARDDGGGCYAFRQAFDERLFNWEFEHFLEYGIAAAAPGIDACRNELRAVARRLAGLPRVFTHRDYHAWNLHVQDGRVRVLDFQDALLGPALYDVASLLTDRITPSRIPVASRRKLLARFARQVPAASLGDMDPETGFDLCAIQRILKVIGRFNYLSEVKGKPRYAALLPDIVSTARALCARRAELRDHIRSARALRKGRTPVRAMILAAGEGLRLRPLTEHTPKALVEVGGRPLIDYAVEAVARSGIEDVVVNLHHLGERCLVPSPAVDLPRDLLPDSLGRVIESAADKEVDIGDEVFLPQAVLAEGFPDLLRLIQQELYETYAPIRVRLPYQQGALISLFHEAGQVELVEHGRGGVYIQGRIPGRLLAQFNNWQVNSNTPEPEEEAEV